MPQPCTICRHPERGAIDAALVAGTPNRRIAAQYATARAPVTEQALRRHRASHVAATLAAAAAEQAADELLRGTDLLEQLRTLAARAEGILERAERERND